MHRCVIGLLFAACGPGPAQPPAATPVDPVPAVAEEEPAQRPDGYGTSHVATLHGVAADGSWLVLCQAREDTDGKPGIDVRPGRHGGYVGDEMKMFFFVEPGLGRPVVAVIDHSDDDRWVAIDDGGTLLLLDMETGSETPLAAIPSDPMVPHGWHRTAAFGLANRRIVYRDVRDGQLRVVVRELASGDEWVVDPGPEHLMHVWLDPDEEHVLMIVSPGGPTEPMQRGCNGGSISVERWGHCMPEGDFPKHARVGVDTKASRLPPDSPLLDSPPWEQPTRTPNGRTVHAWLEDGRMLFSRTGPKDFQEAMQVLPTGPYYWAPAP